MMKSIALVLLLSSSVDAFAPPRPTFRASRVVISKAPAFQSPQQQQPSCVALQVTTSEDTDDTTTTQTQTPLMKEASNYQAMMDPSLDECEPEEELSETKKLMKQVKEAGVAGIISYALWEFGFWALSVPVVFVGYREVTGHWPDIQNKDDVGKLGAEAFAFVNFARFAVPLRIGLALGTTPWIQDNVVDRFFKKEEDCVAMEVPDADSNGSMNTPSNGEN
jgi:hypothetical protein